LFERREPLAVIDGLLAATALEYELTVVSGNVGDTLVAVLNLWKS